ncbi:unnamed protein product, partial [Gulo gulo]
GASWLPFPPHALLPRPPPAPFPDPLASPAARSLAGEAGRNAADRTRSHGLGRLCGPSQLRSSMTGRRREARPCSALGDPSALSLGRLGSGWTRERPGEVPRQAEQTFCPGLRLGLRFQHQVSRSQPLLLHGRHDRRHVSATAVKRRDVVLLSVSHLWFGLVS